MLVLLLKDSRPCRPRSQSRAPAHYPRPGHPRGLFDLLDLVMILKLALVENSRHP